MGIGSDLRFATIRQGCGRVLEFKLPGPAAPADWRPRMQVVMLLLPVSTVQYSLRFQPPSIKARRTVSRVQYYTSYCMSVRSIVLIIPNYRVLGTLDPLDIVIHCPISETTPSSRARGSAPLSHKSCSQWRKGQASVRLSEAALNRFESQCANANIQSRFGQDLRPPFEYLHVLNCGRHTERHQPLLRFEAASSVVLIRLDYQCHGSTTVQW